jgi:hypothetical protein
MNLVETVLVRFEHVLVPCRITSGRPGEWQIEPIGGVGRQWVKTERVGVPVGQPPKIKLDKFREWCYTYFYGREREEPTMKVIFRRRADGSFEQIGEFPKYCREAKGSSWATPLRVKNILELFAGPGPFKQDEYSFTPVESTMPEDTKAKLRQLADRKREEENETA